VEVVAKCEADFRAEVHGERCQELGSRSIVFWCAINPTLIQLSDKLSQGTLRTKSHHGAMLGHQKLGQDVPVDEQWAPMMTNQEEIMPRVLPIS
jgi:hypothetical protein